MNKRNIFKVLGIIALIAVIGFSTLSCGGDTCEVCGNPIAECTCIDGCNDKTASVITITGITQAGEYAFITFRIPTDPATKFTAWGDAEIKDGTLTFTVLCYEDDHPYGLEGTYAFQILIYPNKSSMKGDGSGYTYSGSISSKPLVPGPNTFAFSSITKAN